MVLDYPWLPLITLFWNKDERAKTFPWFFAECKILFLFKVWFIFSTFFLSFQVFFQYNSIVIFHISPCEISLIGFGRIIVFSPDIFRFVYLLYLLYYDTSDWKSSLNKFVILIFLSLVNLFSVSSMKDFIKP